MQVALTLSWSPTARSAIAGLMRDRDRVQAVILAELPLLLRNVSTSPVPLLDTTEIHVKAAVNRFWLDAA